MSTFRIFAKRVALLAARGVERLATRPGAVGRLVVALARNVGWRRGGVIIRSTVRYPLRQALRVGGGRTTANLWSGRWLARVWNGVRAGGGVRAASIATWLQGRNRIAGHSASVSAALAGFSFTTRKDASVEGVLERVRDLFRNQCRFKSDESWPTVLDGYDVGDFIAKGCNGAIYEARVRQPTPVSKNLRPLITSENSDDTAASPRPAQSDRMAISHFERGDEIEMQLIRRRKQYPLAMKLMFNYEFTSDSDTILRAMSRELVPATTREIQTLLKGNISLPKAHPNIVDIKTAFVDFIPVLPGAEQLYPAALPSLLNDEGLGRSQTLFLVMNRYSMTLREYILLHRYTFRTGRLLFGQLLEALAYLATCNIAHRDMKSNNILVEYDCPDEPPRMVLADFGSCLASGDLRLTYPHADVELGGNYALRPPEVVCTAPGPRTIIDYSKADLWAAGTLAYEIFTRVNPFYYPPPDGLANSTYKETELKPLPQNVFSSIRRLVERLLKRDPVQRPSADVAANVVALTLFRLHFLKDILNRSHSRVTFSDRNFQKGDFSNGDQPDSKFEISTANRRFVEEKFDDSTRLKLTVADVSSLYAAETILGGGSNRQNGSEENTFRNGKKFCKAELQLRTLFLSRLDSNAVSDALSYFVYE